MPGFRKPSNDKTGNDGLIEKGVSGKPSVKSRYGEPGYPGSKGYREPDRKMPSRPPQQTKAASDRYGAGKKVIEKGVRP